jgi:hypothetical protein
MDGKTEARRKANFRKEKLSESAKLTQCLGLIEDSCMPNGTAFDLIQQGLLDRDLEGILVTLDKYFSSADVQSVQEIFRNFSIIVPNQGPQATINARREYLNSLQVMYPDMVLPSAVAVVLMTQATAGSANDAIIAEAMGQITRDNASEECEINFSTLQAEIVKINTIKHISEGNGKTAATPISTVAPALVMNVESTAPREWIRNDGCRYHPWVRYEDGRHQESTCSRKGSDMSFPSAERPAPFLPRSTRRLKEPNKRAFRPKSDQKDKTPQLMMVSNSSKCDDDYYDDYYPPFKRNVEQRPYRCSLPSDIHQ